MNAFLKPCHAFTSTRLIVDQIDCFVLLQLFFWMLFVTVANAQFQKPDYTAPSPNAASLGLFGEVPVSLNTGLPNIEIPIYTAEQGKIKLPITLRYHASGVRINEHPGWVGTNFNLSAGGAITRKVAGAPDEYIKDERMPAQNVVGYYHSFGILDRSDWETSALARTYNGFLIDAQPDEYSFNFLNYSGSFYLNEKGNWAVRSNSKIKVEVYSALLAIPDELSRTCDEPVGVSFPTPTGQNPRTFGGFTLITDDGTKYQFGGVTNAIEYSMPFFGQRHNNYGISDIWVANAWHLTKITSPEGLIVDLSYETDGCSNGKYVANFFSSYTTSMYSGSTFNGLYLLGVIPLSNNCSGASLEIPSEGFYKGNLIRPTYLRTISTDAHTINFSRSSSNELKYEPRILSRYFEQSAISTVPAYVFPFLNNNRVLGDNQSGPAERINALLDKLVWKKLDNIEIVDKNNNLTSKVKFTYSNSASKRLTLEGLSFVNINDQACENKYTFDYYNDYGLPKYLDELDKTDHWGFFNNREHDINNLVSNGFSLYSTRKEATMDINVLRSGALSKITFPTGGITELEYQPHSAYKHRTVSSNGNIGLFEDQSLAIGGLRIYKIKSTDNVSSDSKTKEYEYKLADGKPSGISTGKPVYVSTSYTMAVLENGTGSRTQTVYSLQNLLPWSVNSQGSHIGYSRVKEKLSDGSYTVSTFSNYESTDGTNHNDEAVASNLRIAESDGSRYEPYIDKSFERGLLESEEVYNSAQQPISKKKFFYRALSGDYVRAMYNTRMQVCPTSAISVGSGFPFRIYTYKYILDRQETINYDQTDANRTIQETINYVSYNPDGRPTEVRSTRGDKYLVIKNKYSGDYTFTDGCSEEYYNCRSVCTDRGDGCLSQCLAQYNSCRTGKTYDTPADAIRQMRMAFMTGVLIEQQQWNNDNGTLGLVSGSINMYKSYGANASAYNIKPEKTYQYVNLSPETGISLSSIGVRGANEFFLSYAPNYSRQIATYGGYTTRGEPTSITDQNELTTSLSYHGGAKTGLINQKTIGNQTTTYDYRPLVGVSEVNDANGFNTKYYYDGFNRLQYVRDHWNNLLQSYTYNLSNTTGCGTKPTLPDEPSTNNQLTVNPTTLSKSSSVASEIITVSSNVTWTVSETLDWVNVSTINGNGNGSFTINLTANPSTVNRPGNVTVSGGGITRTISISQAGSGGGSSGALVAGRCYSIQNQQSLGFAQRQGDNSVNMVGRNTSDNNQLWKAEAVGGRFRFTSQGATGTDQVLYADNTSCGAEIKVGGYANDGLHDWLVEASGSVFRVQTQGKTWDQRSAGQSPVLQMCGDNNAGDGGYNQPYRLFAFTEATCPGGSTPPTTSCSNAGTISFQRWDGIAGTSIADLLAATNNLQNTASINTTLSSFEAPTNVADSYGARIRGYLCPPTSGQYVFWVAGDDNVELWLSTTNSPANKVRIAYHTEWTNSREWDRYPAQQKSAVINLVAGQQYYIEALLKEAGGGDNLAVGWAKPGQSQGSPSEVIPGSALVPYSEGGGSTPTLEVTPGSANDLAAGGASSGFTVSSNQSWTISGLPSWATASPAGGGSGNGNFTLNVQANGGNSTRFATIRIRVNDALWRDITISQAGSGGGSSGALVAGRCYSIQNQQSLGFAQRQGDNSVNMVGRNTSDNNQLWKAEAVGGRFRFTSQGATGTDQVLYADNTSCGAEIKVGGYANDGLHDWLVEASGSVFRVQTQGKTWDQRSAGQSPVLQMCGDNNAGDGGYNQPYRLFAFTEATCPGGSTPPTTSCSNAGTISFQRWDGIAGTSIADLLAATNNLQNTASINTTLSSFEAPTNVADSYGARIRGYLCPPTSGQYVFWVAGDDNVELWLSTTNSPANKVRIAYHTEWTNSREWDRYPAQQKSAVINLVAGQQYYIEALLKESGYGDNLAVGWAKPGQSQGSPSEVIPGSALVPYSEGGGSATILSQVRVYFRGGNCGECSDRCTGALVQGSDNNATWETLSTLSRPVSGLNEYAVNGGRAYRYLRYVAAGGCYGELHELEFYSGTTKLTGSPIGGGTGIDANLTYQAALDGNLSNFWHGVSPGSHNYAGIDLNAQGCVAPNLSLGVPVCDGTLKYTVSFQSDGDITTTAGQVQGSSIINIPLGTNLTVTASRNECSMSTVRSANSPANCTNNGECFVIKNQFSGQYLQAMTDNTVQHVGQASGQPNQIWKFESADGGLRISNVSAANKVMYVDTYSDDQPVRLGADQPNTDRYRWIKETVSGTTNFRVRSGDKPWLQQYAGTEPLLQIWGNVNVAPQVNNPSYSQFTFQIVGCPN